MFGRVKCVRHPEKYRVFPGSTMFAIVFFSSESIRDIKRIILKIVTFFLVFVYAHLSEDGLRIVLL